MKKNSYIGITFVILIFGIYAIPKIVDRFMQDDVVEQRKSLRSDDGLAFLMINDTAKKMPDFAFRNQDSLLITQADFNKKVYVVEFFFTSCPTICPIMNKNMRVIEESFGERDDFGIASFSITPKIDSPMVLKKYAEKYGVSSLNWHFLTQEDQDV